MEKKELEEEEFEMAEKCMQWRLPTFYTVFLLPFVPASFGRWPVILLNDNELWFCL